ncbi:AtpZ/AtpI family protein [Stakelama tenebrarum]|uniref:ATP synthase protein I n=1 Tax=Stakelama tenebrarum TaxID=2711215 RepID=A0A6G6Y2T3_9SPHN|nr:AtpZ/AtpI family protein [Sphingosinithalassobacter tenebrarum]QIG79235.1 F0F1 ATP synthase assembly protein I [Sphingosinithalassobacter tenebrarum]
MAEDEPGLDPLKEDARLTSLDERLRQAKSEEAIRSGKARADGDRNYRLGNRVLAELIGGMVGGALIGWVLDRFLGTSPWLLLVLLFLGIASAFRNIIRISTQRSE